jgi:hypothetical protein
MTATHVSARASAGAPRHVLIERRLRRYSPAAQARVRALANRHSRLADLALSFPPLLFALAMPRPGHDPEPAIACIIEGRSLDEVAAAAGVPRWLRWLQVEGLTLPLPMLPSGDLFGCRIVNHMPRSPKLTTAWLAIVSDAAESSSEPFALWIAREIMRDTKTPKANELRLLGLWAWFSQQPETHGYRLMETPWRQEMQFDAAVDAAREWLDRVGIELSLGGRQVSDLWLRPGLFEGFDFVALDSAESLVEEAAAMENCVRTYAYDIASNYSRLWSIRRDGQPIADLEVRRDPGRPLVYVNQLKVARNEDAPIEIWLLVTRWLHEQTLASMRPEHRDFGGLPPDVAVWRTLWRPYWRAKRCFPAWLPLAPSWQAFNALITVVRRRRRRLRR